MAISDYELKTFKEISSPGQKIPGIDDDEIVFLSSYFLINLMFLIIFLNFIPSLFGINISYNFISVYTKVFFLYLPVILFIMLKIAKIGRLRGYVYQKLYMFFQSSLPEEVDLRETPVREFLKKILMTQLGFLWNKETYKKNPLFQNYDLKWDHEVEEKKLKEHYEKFLTFLERYENEYRLRELERKEKYIFPVKKHYEETIKMLKEVEKNIYKKGE